jgi:hypothetical protein
VGLPSALHSRLTRLQGTKILQEKACMHDDLRVPGAIVTSAVPLLETEHDRLRQKQRGIDKNDLQSAIKHGEKIAGKPRPRNGDPPMIYTYKEIVYIVNDVTGEEVTSYTVPLEYEYESVSISAIMLRLHYAARDKIKIDMAFQHRIGYRYL